ncbi:MAG: serine/threonine protein kinase [Deltaproteobacteria bacterium]|nr:serine/threonine protein kinase [Deltaproteobacteria bacterium]
MRSSSGTTAPPPPTSPGASGSALASPAAPAIPAAGFDPQCWIGHVLGTYRILECIGRGGMGVVYRAEHVLLGRPVAIKILLPELARRADMVLRMFREARTVNQIGHPNIIDVVDFVHRTDDDPPLVYVVMELLAGQDLCTRVTRSGPLGIDDALALATQMADALSAVHRAGLMHRDLKPENLFLVGQPDGTLRVKILDFSLAKGFGKRRLLEMTEPGSPVGTPCYMAPEQILTRDVDHRSDIYAFGVVLYYALSGRVPFQGRSFEELLRKQQQAVPPLSGLDLRVDPLAAAFEALVRRCLARDPKDRFQSMDEVLAALGAVRQQEAQVIHRLEPSMIKSRRGDATVYGFSLHRRVTA